MSGIMRLGFVEVLVNNLSQARNFYSQILGLQETRNGDGTLFFKCWDEYDHHSVVLKEGKGPGLVRVGWKVESERDLDELEKKIEEFGIKVNRISKKEVTAVGEGLSFTAPSGQPMILYHEIEQVGRAVVPPEIIPKGLVGISPPHLDHVVISAEDADEAVKFMTSVLGFRVGEQILDPAGHSVASFLFRSNKPHDLAIMRGPHGRYHHFAFYLDDWNEVLRASQLLAQSHQDVEVPPSQHGITRGCTTYFRDLSGNRIETFAGGYVTYPDFPTITWSIEDMKRAVFNFGGPGNLEKFMQWV
ncbi:MAG TPA: catechol 2,3-dioxygenase [Blastocatellia bacterium]|nr:catechol 2,3-dioxygenase [Blastocatellia bacterium]